MEMAIELQHILSKDKFLVPGDLITAFLSGSILKKIQINLLY